MGCGRKGEETRNHDGGADVSDPDCKEGVCWKLNLKFRLEKHDIAPHFTI
jgi:hypothetical protein